MGGWWDGEVGGVWEGVLNVWGSGALEPAFWREHAFLPVGWWPNRNTTKIISVKPTKTTTSIIIIIIRMSTVTCVKNVHPAHGLYTMHKY